MATQAQYDAAYEGIADFEKWFETQTRWTRHTDAIRAYITELEKTAPPITPDVLVEPTVEERIAALETGTGIAAPTVVVHTTGSDPVTEPSTEVTDTGSTAKKSKTT